MKKEQTQIYEAEGQSMGAVGAVIGMIVGVGIATLVLIFVGVLGGQTFQMAESKIDSVGNNVVVGDTFTGNNLTAESLDHSFIQEGTLVIRNSTHVVGNGNFTIDYDAGTVLLKGAVNNGTALTSNYTWGASEIRGYIKEGVISSFGAMKQTADYLPIVVLAVIISIVLALVLGFTAFGKQGGGSAL